MAAGVVVAVTLGLLVSPWLAVWRTKRAREASLVALGELTQPHPNSANRCAVERPPVSLFEATAACSWVNLNDERRCQERLVEFRPRLDAIATCDVDDAVRQTVEGFGVTNLIRLRLQQQARLGGLPCMRAARDAYRYTAVLGAHFAVDLEFDEPAHHLYACGGSLSEADRAAMARSLWATANALPPPHLRFAAHLIDTVPYPIEIREPDTWAYWFETSDWLESADALINTPWPRSTRADPLTTLPVEVPREVAESWLRPQAELRAIALHLAGDRGPHAGWRDDLVSRGLEMERDGSGCLAFTAAPLGGVTSAAYCPEGDAAIVANRWLIEAARAALAYHERTGSWPPVTEADQLTVAVASARGADELRTWAALGLTPPERPPLRLTIATPDPNDLALTSTDILLQIAFIARDELKVREVSLGVLDGVPTAAPLIFRLDEAMIRQQGYTR